LRIAFDENIPPAMARIFKILMEEKQFLALSKDLIIESARDYTPKRGDSDYIVNNDVPWLRRFAAAEGRVVISGDTRMAKEPHERLALVECGFITIFFDSAWNNWKFHRKCALLMNWWPSVIKVVKSARPSSFWRIPSDWTEGATLRQLPNTDAKLLKIGRQIAAQENVRKQRALRKPVPEQGVLNLEVPGGDKIGK
jgi:hypothetical protein